MTRSRTSVHNCCANSPSPASILTLKPRLRMLSRQAAGLNVEVLGCRCHKLFQPCTQEAVQLRYGLFAHRVDPTAEGSERVRRRSVSELTEWAQQSAMSLVLDSRKGFRDPVRSRPRHVHCRPRSSSARRMGAPYLLRSSETLSLVSRMCPWHRGRQCRATLLSRHADAQTGTL